MPSAQLQQHQGGFGLQGNMFSTHNQSHTNTGLQNYNSHFLTTSMQVAAALNAQQFRSAYIKGVGNQQIGDQSGRPQQMKSPNSQEVLSSVFNSGRVDLFRVSRKEWIKIPGIYCTLENNMKKIDIFFSNFHLF